MKIIYNENIAITGYNGYLGSKLSKQMGISKIGELNEVSNIRTIVHLASKVKNDKDSFLNNIKIDLDILEYCKTYNTHLIYASTNNVYPLIENCNINTQTIINDYYSASKFLSEKLIFDLYNISYTCLRIGDVFGMSQSHGNLMKSIENSIKNKQNLELYGEGIKKRSYIYVKDIINLIQFISDKNIKGIFNVCYNDSWTVLQIIDFISKECNLNIIKKNIDKELKNTRTMVPTTIPNFKYSFNMKTSLKDYIAEIKK